ncbi:MAG TPA: hypothetical protein VGX25_25065 [Actinophytocola sp.]|uniref:hypothetical protein n=1 Tax=Actinophytocola sp. TaxID=1872138 RepID=UPI002DDDB330|nr:hypothetical protein [Actinophytocola sp.]HEV2782675.1 hypothetical protein [Actinophytocola sp.]
MTGIRVRARLCQETGDIHAAADLLSALRRRQIRRTWTVRGATLTTAAAVATVAMVITTPRERLRRRPLRGVDGKALTQHYRDDQSTIIPNSGNGRMAAPAMHQLARPTCTSPTPFSGPPGDQTVDTIDYDIRTWWTGRLSDHPEPTSGVASIPTTPCTRMFGPGHADRVDMWVEASNYLAVPVTHRPERSRRQRHGHHHVHLAPPGPRKPGQAHLYPTPGFRRAG